MGLTDEDVERIANRVADKLADLLNKRQPARPPPPVDNRLQIGRAETALRLGCSPWTLDHLVRRGLIHPNRATRHPKFSLKELERFIADCS
jgi:predicted component of type VI protein secretion system